MTQKILLVFIVCCGARLSLASEFYQHAQVQPVELSSGRFVITHASEIMTCRTWEHYPINILDIHHNDKHNATTLAYGGASGDKQYIGLYDPQNKRVMQILFFNKNKHLGALGASFSEDARFLTVGTVREVCDPQVFYVYELAQHKRKKELEGLLPAALIVIIQSYENDQSYVHHRTVDHCPSLLSRLRLPDIIVSSFLYDSHKKTITCLGNPGSSLNTLTTFIGVEKLTGTLAPVVAISVDQPSERTVLASGKTYPAYYCLKTSIHRKFTHSPNKRYVVYTNSKNGTAYCLDRMNNSEVELKHLAKLPPAIDNTGTMHLQRYYFNTEKAKKPYMLSIIPLSDVNNKPMFSCTYPAEEAWLFGRPDFFYMDKNYCFTSDLHLRQSRPTEDAVVAAGILIPKSGAAQTSKSSVAQNNFHKQAQQNILYHHPSLHELEQDDNVVRNSETDVHHNSVWRSKILPYANSLLGALGFLGALCWSQKTLSLSPEVKKNAFYACGFGALYSFYKLYRQAYKTHMMGNL